MLSKSMEDTRSCDWEVVVKIRVNNLCFKGEPDPKQILIDVLNDDRGFGGITDWPEDYEIVSLTHIGDK